MSPTQTTEALLSQWRDEDWINPNAPKIFPKNDTPPVVLAKRESVLTIPKQDAPNRDRWSYQEWMNWYNTINFQIEDVRKAIGVMEARKKRKGGAAAAEEDADDEESENEADGPS